jgi:restriction system protein
MFYHSTFECAKKPKLPNVHYSPGDEHTKYESEERTVRMDKIREILSRSANAPPHGIDLLKPIPVPVLPSIIDTSAIMYKPYHEQAEKLNSKIYELEKKHEQQFMSDSERVMAIIDGCQRNDINAINDLMKTTNNRHYLENCLRGSFETDIDLGGRIILINIEVPDFSGINIEKFNNNTYKTSPVSASDKKRSFEAILYSLCIRAAYLVSCSDVGNWFDALAVNAWQKWHDGATGALIDGTIASLFVTKENILRLDIDHVDPHICFKHFKGIATPSIECVSPIRPILIMSKRDNRIIENREVANSLETEENIAAMPWDDFEHLVRQLFEWEFGRIGVEVMVTRASRDRGVDAIMYDPDPIRGGKYIIQAKRYTRTVDVSAVRDLYGTILNEGANRGILVTTSSYGPDSYEFAKDKPISLVDGPNLIAILRRHGRMFRIDLDEARGMEKTSF